MSNAPGIRVAKTVSQELWPETSASTCGQKTRKHGAVARNKMLNICRLFICKVNPPKCQIFIEKDLDLSYRYCSIIANSLIILIKGRSNNHTIPIYTPTSIKILKAISSLYAFSLIRLGVSQRNITIIKTIKSQIKRYPPFV